MLCMLLNILSILHYIFLFIFLKVDVQKGKSNDSKVNNIEYISYPAHQTFECLKTNISLLLVQLTYSVVHHP